MKTEKSKEIYGVIIGIDPGLKGGISVIQGSKLSLCKPLPIKKRKKKQGLNLYELKYLLLMYKQFNPIVYIEECWAHGPQNFRYARKKSPQSMFTFGQGYGELIGLLEGLEINYKIVAPNKWKNKLKLTGINKTKQDSIIKIKEYFPNICLKPSNRYKKDHDGMAESVLIAIYGGLEEWI